jgi:type II secretory pathway component GspD/PulD (secretin)
MLNGLRVTDLSRFMAALATQGKVSVLANPRLLALNNEPAVVRSTSPVSGTREGDRERDDEGVTLGVTPQIAGEGVVMLSLSPIVSVRSTDADDKTPAFTAIGETDTLARVGDGETIVVAGFTREVEIKERKNAGRKGGWFGRATIVTRKRVELLILLTPKILTAIGPQ